MSERFWFPDTFEWFAKGGLDKVKQFYQKFAILLGPVSEIIKKLWLKDGLAPVGFI